MAKEFTDSQIEKITELVHSHYNIDKPFLSREKGYEQVEEPDVFQQIEEFEATEAMGNISASPPSKHITNELGVLHFSIYKIHYTNKETVETSVNYSFGTDLSFVRYSKWDKFFSRLEDLMERVEENSEEVFEEVSVETYTEKIREIADEDNKVVNKNP